MNEKNQLNGNSHINFGFSEEDEEKKIDVRKALDRILKHWYWFLISAIIGLVGAWLYLRYASPDYKINAKILVSDDKKGGDIPGQEILSQLEMFSNKSNVDNELEILKSRSLMEKTVRDLQLNVFYFYKGRIRTTEQFGKVPFNLDWINLKDTLKVANYVITPQGEDKFLFSREDLKKEGHWGDTLYLPEGVLKISRNPIFALTKEEYLIRVLSIDDAVALYQHLLDVSIPNKQVSTIDLSFQSTIPAKGEAILNRLIQNYLRSSVDDKNRIVDSTIAFVDGRLAIVSEELSGVEKDIQKFKQQNELADIQEQAKMLVSGTGDFDKQLTEQAVRLSVVESLQQYMADDTNNKRVVPSSLIVQDPTFVGLVGRYNALQLEKDRLLMSSTESNPVVVNLNQQLTALRNDMRSSLASLSSGIKASIAELEKKAGVLTQQIRQVPGKERIFLDYSRQQEIKQELYLFLLKKREESAISKSSNLATARIIDAAKSESRPFKPKSTLMYALGLLLGFLLPGAILYLQDLLSRRIRNKQDILDNTPVPIIAEIGHNDEDHVVFDNRSPLAEQFRALRTNLQFVLSNADEKVIMLTSTMSGEGKSFVSTSLASVLALSGKKVVLMEMDLRKPKISEKLGLSNFSGFSTYSIGKTSVSELIKPSGFNDNCFVISSGPIPPNPTELILQERTRHLFQELRNQFDYIIIDTAPIGLVTDAQLLAKYADATMYLVRQRYTFKNQLMLPKELYINKKFPKLNIVVNDVKVGDEYGYGYGYGAYGENEGKYQENRILKKLKKAKINK